MDVAQAASDGASLLQQIPNGVSVVAVITVVVIFLKRQREAAEDCRKEREAALAAAQEAAALTQTQFTATLDRIEQRHRDSLESITQEIGKMRDVLDRRIPPFVS